MNYKSFLKCILSWQEVHGYESWVDSDYEDVYKYSGYDTKSTDFLKESLSYINAFKVYPLTKTDGPQRFLTTLELFRAARKQEYLPAADEAPGQHCSVPGCSQGVLSVVAFYFESYLTDKELAEQRNKYRGFSFKFLPGWKLVCVMPYRPYGLKPPDWFMEHNEQNRRKVSSVLQCRCGRGNPNFPTIESLGDRFRWGDKKDYAVAEEEVERGRAALGVLLPKSDFKPERKKTTLGEVEYDDIPF
jgi:hypothetical protein